MIGFWADFFTFLQVVIGLFLIFIIMLQRGKGGGLVGALGGMGGASAFGPKADVQVLKLTIGLAVAWVVFACVGIFFNRWYAPSVYGPTGKPAAAVATETKDADSKTKDDADKSKSAPATKNEAAATGDAGPDLKPQEKKAAPETSTPAKTEEEKPAAKPVEEKKPAAADKAEAPAEKPAAEKPAPEKAAEDKK